MMAVDRNKKYFDILSSGSIIAIAIAISSSKSSISSKFSSSFCDRMLDLSDNLCFQSLFAASVGSVCLIALVVH